MYNINTSQNTHWCPISFMRKGNILQFCFKEDASLAASPPIFNDMNLL